MFLDRRLTHHSHPLRHLRESFGTDIGALGVIADLDDRRDFCQGSDDFTVLVVNVGKPENVLARSHADQEDKLFREKSFIRFYPLFEVWHKRATVNLMLLLVTTM